MRTACLAAALALTACATGSTRPDALHPARQRPAEPPDAAWAAHLAPLNAGAASGATLGRVQIVRRGDALEVAIDVRDAPPGVVHMQHAHGFADGAPARCATVSDDTNRDGLVDLAETETPSGTTLVPFHGEPASLDLAGPGYPEADATGAWHYRARISFAGLEEALRRDHGLEALRFDPLVIYVHGIDPDRPLPASVESLPEVPAQATLPIACGVLQQVAPRGAAVEAGEGAPPAAPPDEPAPGGAG